MTISTAIIFSSEAIAKFRVAGFVPAVLESTLEYEFTTQDELESFLEGVDAATGSEQYEIAEMPEDTTISRVAFGDESDEFQASDFIDIEHGSVALRKAYEYGLEAGEGWLNHYVLEGDDLERFNQVMKPAPVLPSDPSAGSKPRIDESNLSI